MKYYYCILAFSLMLSSLQAQDCSCSESFQGLAEAVEQDYALFPFRVSSEEGNIHLYEALKESLATKALSVQSSKDCTKIFDTYINFFNDGHLSASLNINEDTPSKPKLYETVQMDSMAIVEKLKKQKKNDPIVGIWEMETYKIAILKEKNKAKKRDYVGIILASKNDFWHLGGVKMELSKRTDDEYKIKFYMGNGSLKESILRIEEKYTFRIEALREKWRKLFSLPEGVEPVTWAELGVAIQFEDLGNQNYYLKIPSFEAENAEAIQKLVDTQHEQLVNANILIIDVQDNPGGNDDTYAPLLPYIHTDAIKLPTVGMRVGKGNKEMFLSWFTEERIAEGRKAGVIDDNTMRMINEVKANENEFVYSEEEDYSFEELDTIYSHPKKVAIIANRKSGSSAETFVYRCRQSDRVVTFGQNTAGVVDGFMTLEVDLNCFRLRYPTSIRTRFLKEDAIDPMGMYPDVYLDEAQENVVEFIIDFMDVLD